MSFIVPFVFVKIVHIYRVSIRVMVRVRDLRLDYVTKHHYNGCILYYVSHTGGQIYHATQLCYLSGLGSFGLYVSYLYFVYDIIIIIIIILSGCPSVTRVLCD